MGTSSKRFVYLLNTVSNPPHSLQVNELVLLSLNRPVKLFIDNSTDVAENLRQEFVRIKKSREEDRTAIVVGTLYRPHIICFVLKGNGNKIFYRLI